MSVATVNINASTCDHINADVTIEGEVYSVGMKKSELKEALTDPSFIKDLVLRNAAIYYRTRKLEGEDQATIIAEINAKEFKY